MYKVIVNANDLKMMNAILKQIKNLKNAMHDSEIEVVFTRSAVKALLKNSGYNNKIKEIIDSGVKMDACVNTLKELNLSKEDVDTSIGIGFVDAGVEEIVKKQAEGYSYLQL